MAEREGIITKALPMIEKMAASGELGRKIVVMHRSQMQHFDLDDYPELKGEQVGSEIVLIVAGIVTGVPKPEEKKDTKSEKGGPIAVEGAFGGKTIEVHLTETAVVHGDTTEREKGPKPERKGKTASGGLAAAISRKKYGAAQRRES